MTEPAFLEMRASLVERGLLCGETLQLTPEGNDHVAEMMAGLRLAPPPPEPSRDPVRWDLRRIGRPAERPA
jgi:hypothetical protein